MAKIPVELANSSILAKNIVLTRNYYPIDSSATFSTTKVKQICDDIISALSPDTNAAGLIQLRNAFAFVGFYEVAGSNYISITLSTYTGTGEIFIIGINNNVAYSKTVKGT